MRILLSLGVLITTSIGYAAEPTYTIKLKLVPDIGQTVTIKSKNKESVMIKLLDDNGKPIENKDSLEEVDREYTETVLERDKNGYTTKALRMYKKARKIEDGKERSLSYEGSTLLIEKRGEQWQLSVAGTVKVDKAEADGLLRAFEEPNAEPNILKHLAPKRPVVVGESWSLDAKSLFGEVTSYEVLLEKSSAKATLTKVLTQGKTTFGVFTVELTMTIKRAIGLVTFDPPGVITKKSTLTVAIDGNSTERSQQSAEKIVGKGSYDFQKIRLELAATQDQSLEISVQHNDPQARVIPKVTLLLGGAAAWTEFASKEHGFKVSFPFEPKAMKGDETKDLIEKIYRVSQGNDLEYAVTVIDFLNDGPATAKKILQWFADQDTVKMKRELTLNGFDGYELTMIGGPKDRPFEVVRRIVVVNSRMYVITYMERNEKKGDMKKFFDSFQLDAKNTKKDK